VAPVGTQRERVFQVFGDRPGGTDRGGRAQRAQVLPLPKTRSPPGRFHPHGFISRPQVQKSNRNSIYLFVNRRLIRDRLLLHAISAAYHNLMPPACYPFALLFLDCDPGEVDVNVHPSKTEVRFRHGSFVHDFVRDTIRETSSASARPPRRRPLHSPLSAGRGVALLRVHAVIGTPARRSAPQRSAAPGPYRLQPTAAPAPRFDFSDPLRRRPRAAACAEGPRHAHRISGRSGRRPPAHHGRACPNSASSARSTTASFSPPDATASGSSTSTSRTSASSSRRSSGAGAAGRRAAAAADAHGALIHPRAAGRVRAHRRRPGAAGFETEPFGRGTIAVKAAPAACPRPRSNGWSTKIIEMAESELRSVSVDDLRRGIAASVACRAAIKINMPPRHGQDGVAAPRTRGDRLSDGLPPRPPRRPKLRPPRHPPRLPPHLTMDR
jgi:DNA mismatch repair protein MutL